MCVYMCVHVCMCVCVHMYRTYYTLVLGSHYYTPLSQSSDTIHSSLNGSSMCFLCQNWYNPYGDLQTTIIV